MKRLVFTENGRRLGRALRAVLCAGVGTLVLTGAASAAKALPTYIEGQATAGAVTDSTPNTAVPDGSIASGSWSASDGLASASASLTGGPVILLTAAGSATLAGGYAYADSGINYFVTVDAPDGFTDLVPIRFVANLAAGAFASRAPTGGDAEPFAIGDAAFALGGNLYTTGPNIFEVRACTSACTSGAYANGVLQGASPTYAISGLTGLRPGDTGVVSESVFIQAGVGTSYAGQTANAWASADPFFFIDPDFALDHPGFSLTFSQGVENNPLAGGAPEPGAWALMLVGFAALGTMLRGRRRHPVVPAPH